MFSKAKLKRFNEEIGCAPPPTKYDPKISEKPLGCYLEKSDRWRGSKNFTPGPTTYLCPTMPAAITPRKKNFSVSTSRLNSSSCSSASLNSNTTGFISPLQPLSRSKSVRGSRNKFEEQTELKEKILALEEEKNALKQTIKNLEQQFAASKFAEVCQTQELSKVGVMCEASTQVELSVKTVENIDQPKNLCIKRDCETLSDCEAAYLPKEELQIIQDKVQHLTLLRDNLEASVANKEDAIADLQMQIDLIVAEAEESHEEMEVYKEQVLKVQEQLQKTFEEKSNAELKVKDLVSKYEALLCQHKEERKINKDIMGQKDIEIELLNDSVATLNTQVSEYNKTINRIQSDVSLKRSQISSLELAVGDLSIATKEREFVEVLLEDEIKEKDKEVFVLEKSLGDLEEQLLKVIEERDFFKTDYEILEEKVKNLELNLKEKEVLEQFLEKEMTSREAEITDSNNKLVVLEDELEKTRKIALDLQQEAESQLNEVIGLKATLSVKTFEIEYKEDIISSLKEEVNLNVTSAIKFKEGLSDSEKLFAKLREQNSLKTEKLSALDEEVLTLKSSLKKEIGNTKQLEERVIELMAEIGDRDAEHKQRLDDKEFEIQGLTVKYSDALLEQESMKRLLTSTSETLDKETLLFQATERELNTFRDELCKKSVEHTQLEGSVKELTLKLIHIEDALACEEAAANEAQERMKTQFKDSQDLIEKLKMENKLLQSSNEGFMSQINMLKIGMTKKSVAIEEMQTCIEALREEKNCLVDNCRKTESILREKETLLADIQDEFESRLNVITNLQILLDGTQLAAEKMTEKFDEINKVFDTKINNLEEEKNNFLCKISQLENQIKELEDEKCNFKMKAHELEDKVLYLEEQKSKEVLTLSSQLEDKELKSITYLSKLESLQQILDGYEDRLNNMKVFLLEKTSEVENLQESNITANVTLESYRKKINDLQSTVDNLVFESQQLSTLITSKDKLLTDYSESLKKKRQEIELLQKVFDKKQEHNLLMEKRLLEIENPFELVKEEKLKAISVINNLQEDLAKSKEELIRLTESISKQNDHRVLQLENDYQNELEGLRSVNHVLRVEADAWKNKFDYLENMIEPFREQLDAYESERAALLSQMEEDHEEVSKLSGAYAKLLGHNNHKQKIQHVVKLKTENNELREKVHKLQAEAEKQRKALRRLEDKFEQNSGFGKGKKFDKENKENSSMLASANTSDFPQVTSTPLRSVNRYHRL